MKDYAWVRGFNYQPGGGSCSYENWMWFDGERFARELDWGKAAFPGMNALRLLLRPDGKIALRGGSGQWLVAEYRNGETLDILLKIDCRRKRISASVNGQDSGDYMPISPCRTVERLTLRTGPLRREPTIETELKNVRLPDIPGAGERGPEAVYRLYQLDIGP